MYRAGACCFGSEVREEEMETSTGVAGDFFGAEV